MELKIGESKTFKLPIWLKAVDILYEKNGLRLERQRGGIVCLNVNDGSRRTAYAAIPLGRVKDLNQYGFTVKIQSKARTLFNVGNVKFVIDYAAKKVATNVLGMRIMGSKEWGDHVQSPWKPEYMPLFGLPKPEPVMDRKTGEIFWKWFHENESAIITFSQKGRKETRIIEEQINLWMHQVFPYDKGADVKFKLVCKDEPYGILFTLDGQEQLAEDAQTLAEMMPDALKRRWEFILQE